MARSRVFSAAAIPLHDVAWGRTKEMIGVAPAPGGEPCGALELKITEFPPGYSHAGHLHSEQLEVLYVLAGRGVHQDATGKTSAFGPGDIVYIPAGCRHANHNPHAETLRVLVIKVPPSRG